MIQNYIQGGTLFNVLGICLLLAGITVCARMPRLARDKTCRALAAGVFALGCVAYAGLLHPDMQERIGGMFKGWFLFSETIGVLAMAAILVLVSWYFIENRKGDLAPLMIGGIIVIAVLIGPIIVKDGDKEDLWPLVLSGAAFLYLWWLAALIFDLAFVWHRYIRRGVLTGYLWYRKNNPAGNSGQQAEEEGKKEPGRRKAIINRLEVPES